MHCAPLPTFSHRRSSSVFGRLYKQTTESLAMRSCQFGETKRAKSRRDRKSSSKTKERPKRLQYLYNKYSQNGSRRPKTARQLRSLNPNYLKTTEAQQSRIVTKEFKIEPRTQLPPMNDTANKLKADLACLVQDTNKMSVCKNPTFAYSQKMRQKSVEQK